MALSRIIQLLNYYSEKISLFHVIILSCLFALISIMYTQGGILYGEMYIRLPFYMSDMPLLNKLFDSKILDDGCYRARELSYLLDVIDFKFVKFSIENGFPHFLSLTHYIFSIATGCVLWSFCVKELNLRPLVGIGWLILFWTSPSIFLSALNRTGKIWVTLLTAILFYFIYKVVAASKRGVDFQFSKKIWLLYFIIIFMMTFLDEQGIFLGITLLIFLTIWSIFVRHKNIFIMLLIGATIIVVHGLYRYMIAPQLTFITNGYWPDFSFQKVPVQYFINNVGTCLLSGLSLYIDNFRFLIGNPPLTAAYGLLIIFILFPVYYLRTSPELSSNDRKFFILAQVELLVTSFFLLIVMNSLMVIKSPNLMWPEFRRVYYWSPTIIMLAMTLAILTDIFYKSRVPKWLVIMGICLAITGNIVALPKHKAIILEQGYFKQYVQPSSALLNALTNIESLNDTDDPLIKKNPVFQFFASKKKSLPDGASAYNDRGIFHAYLGLHKLAVEDFYMAIGLKQDYLNARERIILCHELNQNQLAAEDDKAASLLKKDYAEAYNNRGINSAKLEQYSRAIDYFNEAISLKQDYAEAFNNRGTVYIKFGKYQKAIADYNESIRLKPYNAEAFNNRGAAYLTQGNNEIGCRDAYKACELGSCRTLEVAKGKGDCP